MTDAVARAVADLRACYRDGRGGARRGRQATVDRVVGVTVKLTCDPTMNIDNVSVSVIQGKTQVSGGEGGMGAAAGTASASISSPSNPFGGMQVSTVPLWVPISVTNV